MQQLAGVGSGCDSIFTQVDNGSGYGIKGAGAPLDARLLSSRHMKCSRGGKVSDPANKALQRRFKLASACTVVSN